MTRNQQLQNSNQTSTFTPSFSAGLLARFPALGQSTISVPKREQTQHKLLKRVHKPLKPQVQLHKQARCTRLSSRPLRKSRKHSFSGRLSDVNVAKIVRSSQKRNNTVNDHSPHAAGNRHAPQTTHLAYSYPEKLAEVESYMDHVVEGKANGDQVSFPASCGSDLSRSPSPIGSVASSTSCSSRGSSPESAKLLPLQ